MAFNGTDKNQQLNKTNSGSSSVDQDVASVCQDYDSRNDHSVAKALPQHDQSVDSQNDMNNPNVNVYSNSPEYRRSGSLPAANWKLSGRSYDQHILDQANKTRHSIVHDIYDVQGFEHNMVQLTSHLDHSNNNNKHNNTGNNKNSNSNPFNNSVYNNDVYEPESPDPKQSPNQTPSLRLTPSPGITRRSLAPTFKTSGGIGSGVGGGGVGTRGEKNGTKDDFLSRISRQLATKSDITPTPKDRNSKGQKLLTVQEAVGHGAGTEKSHSYSGPADRNQGRGPSTERDYTTGNTAISTAGRKDGITLEGSRIFVATPMSMMMRANVLKTDQHSTFSDPIRAAFPSPSAAHTPKNGPGSGQNHRASPTGPPPSSESDSDSVASEEYYTTAEESLTPRASPMSAFTLQLQTQRSALKATKKTNQQVSKSQIRTQ
jgi:hypothetical protein